MLFNKINAADSMVFSFELLVLIRKTCRQILNVQIFETKATNIWTFYWKNLHFPKKIENQMKILNLKILEQPETDAVAITVIYRSSLLYFFVTFFNPFLLLNCVSSLLPVILPLSSLVQLSPFCLKYLYSDKTN